MGLRREKSVCLYSFPLFLACRASKIQLYESSFEENVAMSLLHKKLLLIISNCFVNSNTNILLKCPACSLVHHALLFNPLPFLWATGFFWGPQVPQIMFVLRLSHLWFSLLECSSLYSGPCRTDLFFHVSTWTLFSLKKSKSTV